LGLDLNRNLSEINSQFNSIIAIGDNEVRKKLSLTIESDYGIVKHSTSVISSSVTIGEGSMVLHQATIQVDCKVGKHVIINTAASVDHDCLIEDYVHIAPGSVLCGNVKIGEGTFIGAGTTIIPNVSIGKWCTIGAGSVIIKDVPDFAVVVGNPGRIIKTKKHG
jgi:sugar O-acyltransferase (sialic acid O-acetyltransferase NeuD family)